MSSGGTSAGGTGERVLVVVESPTRALALRKAVGPSVRVVATCGNVFGPRGKPRPGGGRILQQLRDEGRRADRIVIATDRDREGEGIAAGLLGFLGPLFPGRVSRGYVEDGGLPAPAGGGQAAAPVRDGRGGEAALPVRDRRGRGAAAPVRDGRGGEAALPLRDGRGREAAAPVRDGRRPGSTEPVAAGGGGGAAPWVRFAEVDRRRAVARALRDEADRRFLAATGRILGGAACGRVQAAGLERVVERSREEPSTWAVEVRLEVGGERLPAVLAPELASREEALAVAGELAGRVLAARAIRRRRFEEPPPPPFDTGSLLAEAEHLRLGPERVLEAARVLHRGVELADGKESLLSYPRTDEPVLEADPHRPPAHGAIRPVAPEWTPERAAPYLRPAERKVYERVVARTAAASAGCAVLEELEAELEGAGRRFVARAVRVIEPGWRAVDGDSGPGGSGDSARRSDETGRQGEGRGAAPDPAGRASVGGPGEAGARPVDGGGAAAGPGGGRDSGGPRNGEGVRVLRARAVERPGTGPFRPGELIADLAGRGIGRPSTWATVARGLREVGWVRGDGGRLRATNEGRRVWEALRSALGPLAENATALEAGLRAVEEGRWGPEEFRRRFVRPLVEASDTGPTRRCPRCGRPLRESGTCSGFPVCRGTP
jgi:DNA topoisomerase IA